MIKWIFILALVLCCGTLEAKTPSQTKTFETGYRIGATAITYPKCWKKGGFGGEHIGTVYKFEPSSECPKTEQGVWEVGFRFGGRIFKGSDPMNALVPPGEFPILKSMDVNGRKTEFKGRIGSETDDFNGDKRDFNHQWIAYFRCGRGDIPASYSEHLDAKGLEKAKQDRAIPERLLTLISGIKCHD